jgi:hypothetical protein
MVPVDDEEDSDAFPMPRARFLELHPEITDAGEVPDLVYFYPS